MDPNQMPPMGGISCEPKKGGTGALIGSLIVILILVLGALYFWGAKIYKNGEGQNAAESSDTTSNIDADFNNLETVTLDEDLGALNQ